MKLADLKRYIEVGQIWDCELYVLVDGVPKLEWSPGPRKVASKNSVGFGFHQGGRVSYCNWPKAKEVMFLEPTEE